MPFTTPSTEPNFNRIARLYRWAEYLALGPFLQQTRTALLDRLSGCHHALLFGDGDGRFLARLLVRNPAQQATAVDTSSAMLRLLQARCQHASPDAASRLSILQTNALDAPIPPATDLLVTHFFLDCLTQEEVDRLAVKIAASVKPGTLWLLSDFELPSAPVFRHAARLYIRALYLAFRLLTGLRVQHLPNPQAALAASGFYRLARHRKLGGLLYSELWVLGGPASSERHNPAAPGFIHSPMAPPSEDSASSKIPASPATDPLPDPEPAVPSLPEPDPGVFHHETARLPSNEPSS